MFYATYLVASPCTNSITDFYSYSSVLLDKTVARQGFHNLISTDNFLEYAKSLARPDIINGDILVTEFLKKLSILENSKANELNKLRCI